MAYKYGGGGGGAGRATAIKAASKKNTPGVLSRLLDVVSRPQYMSAGLALGKGPGESLSMAWKGLQGKGKYSYSDVLKQRLGVTGKPAAILGFGLDVALDPTTYLGVGIGKAGAQGLGKGVAKTAGREYVSAGAKAIQEARKLEKAGSGGATLFKPGATLFKPGMATQIASKGAKSSAATVGSTLAKGLPGGPTRRALELKVMGKTVASSPRAYEAAAKVLRPIAKSPTGDLVGRTFRTAHGLPQSMRQVSRKHAGVSAQDFDRVLQDIKTTFSGTSKTDRKVISSAIAKGTVETLDDRLKPLAKYAEEHLDRIRPPTGVGTKQGRLFDDTLEPLSKTADALPKDADDIADVLAKSYDKHFTKQAYEGFKTEVMQRFPDELNNPEVRAALERTERVFAPGSKEGAEWTRKFDKVQGIWKMAVTAPNPGFHVRNLMGDTYLNYLDGVVDPRVYERAVSALRGGKVQIRVGSKTLGSADIIRLYEEQGLRSRFTRTENILGGTGSKVLHGIGKVSDFREDMVRVAHFIDALGKEVRHGRKFDDAVEAAAARVRKFNIDYGDLTEMEKTFKRAIPFYTFVRKALPTQLEMVFTRPGRIAALPKGQQAIERLLGVRTEENQGPLPGIDEVVPPWMRDQFMISRGKNRVWTPDLPIDLLGEYANPVKGTLGALSPALTAPVELVTGKTIPYGFNQKASLARYMMNQTPLTRQAANVATQDDAGSKAKRYVGGPLVTKIVSGAPERKKSTTKSRSKSGGYKYGS